MEKFSFSDLPPEIFDKDKVIKGDKDPDIRLETTVKAPSQLSGMVYSSLAGVMFNFRLFKSLKDIFRITEVHNVILVNQVLNNVVTFVNDKQKNITLKINPEFRIDRSIKLGSKSIRLTGFADNLIVEKNKSDEIILYMPIEVKKESTLDKLKSMLQIKYEMISLYEHPIKVFGLLTDGNNFIFLKLEHDKETKPVFKKRLKGKLLELKISIKMEF